MRVHFTSLAERQLDRLHQYLTEQASEQVADAYVNRIVEFCQKLSAFPLRGARRDDLLLGLRTIGFERRATIAFMVNDAEVLIEGVFYGGQDFEMFFRDEGHS